MLREGPQRLGNGPAEASIRCRNHALARTSRVADLFRDVHLQTSASRQVGRTALVGVMQECLQVIAMTADVDHVDNGLPGQLACTSRVQFWMVPGRSTFDSMNSALPFPFMTVGSMKGGSLPG